MVLVSIVISVVDLVLQTTGTDYLLSSSSIGAGLLLFLLVVAGIARLLNSSQEYQETQDLASKNPLARDVLTLYFYGNFKKILAGVTNVMKDVASLLTFPLTGKNPFVFESMQDLYFPNGLLEMVDVEVKAGRLIVKNRNEYERLKEADIKGTGLTELLKLTQNEILKLSLSSKPDPSLANYRANRCQFLFPDSSGSVVLSAFKGCLSSVERVRAFRGIRQRRIAAFLVFAVGEKKPVSDLKLKLELNAKKITNELAACEGP